jgi:hypothetical protein
MPVLFLSHAVVCLVITITTVLVGHYVNGYSIQQSKFKRPRLQDIELANLYSILNEH